MNLEVLLILGIILVNSLILWLLITIKWKSYREMFHTSYTSIDLLFIFLYFFEQLSLGIILATTNFSPQVVVGIFALFVVTTASLQNRAWESRINAISDEVVKQKLIIDKAVKENQKVLEENKKLEDSLKKSNDFINKLFVEFKNIAKEVEKINLKKKR